MRKFLIVYETHCLICNGVGKCLTPSCIHLYFYLTVVYGDFERTRPSPYHRKRDRLRREPRQVICRRLYRSQRFMNTGQGYLCLFGENILFIRCSFAVPFFTSAAIFCLLSMDFSAAAAAACCLLFVLCCYFIPHVAFIYKIKSKLEDQLFIMVMQLSNCLEKMYK